MGSISPHFFAPSEKSPVRSARQKFYHSVSPTLKLLNFANILRHWPNVFRQKRSHLVFAKKPTSVDVCEINPWWKS
jgi:hypothetical protein